MSEQGRRQIINVQRQIFDLVREAYPQYYLTGGTALAFYFQHRFSEDLDFFTQSYDPIVVDEILEYIQTKTHYSYECKGEENRTGLLPMKVFDIDYGGEFPLKIDFVGDSEKNLEDLVDGIHSVMDIYYKKLLAATGRLIKEDGVGRSVATGRQKSKDFYDLYYLSRNVQPLEDVFLEYFPYNYVENLLAWYKSFDRIQLTHELLELVPDLDMRKIILYMDEQILETLPKKILEGF